MAKYVIAFALFLLVGVPLIKVAFFPTHVVNKTVEMSYGIVDKTLNADNAVYNYEWFKKAYGEIQSAELIAQRTASDLETLRSSLPADRSAWTFEDKQELYRMNSVLAGQNNYVISLKKEYDSRASMANRAIFKDIPASFGF